MLIKCIVMRLKNSLRFIKFLFLSVFCFGLVLNTASYAQDSADPKKGEALFKSLCASCHKRYKRAVGPALHKVTDRHDVDWIYKWIKNSAEMIKSGDAEAVAIYEEYNKVAMNAFPQLSTSDIDNILAYVNEEKAAKPPVNSSSVASSQSQAGSSSFSQDIVLGLLVVVLALLVGLLFLVTKTLKSIAKANGLNVEESACGASSCCLLYTSDAADD